MPPSIQRTSNVPLAPRRRFLRSVSTKPLLILAALVTGLYRAGILYESYIQSHHDSVYAAFPRALAPILRADVLPHEFSIILSSAINLADRSSKKRQSLDRSAWKRSASRESPLDAFTKRASLRFRPILRLLRWPRCWGIAAGAPGKRGFRAAPSSRITGSSADDPESVVDALIS